MHPWDVSPKEAIAIQKNLQSHINLTDDFGEIKTIAGVDVGFEQNNTITRAAIAVLYFQTLKVIETAIVHLFRQECGTGRPLWISKWKRINWALFSNEKSAFTLPPDSSVQKNFVDAGDFEGAARFGVEVGDGHGDAFGLGQFF